MRCFLVRIDPNLVAGTNTEAYVVAPNAATAKQWGEKRWHVDASQLQTEAKAKSQIPEGQKVVEVKLEGAEQVKVPLITPAAPKKAKPKGSPFPTKIAGEPLRIPKTGS